MKTPHNAIVPTLQEALRAYFDQCRDENIQLSGLHQMIMESVEENLITIALQESNDVKSQAAKILGLNRTTLHRKIEYYNSKR